MHEPASLTRNYGTRVLPSQLDAWLGPTSESLAPSRVRQAGWRAAGPPIRLCCAGPARHAKSVSIQQQPATFQVAGCFSISGLQECAATSAPPSPRPASQRASASQRSMLMLGLATSDVMAGAGGTAGPAPDVRHQPAGDVHPQFCIQHPYTIQNRCMYQRWWCSGVNSHAVCMRFGVLDLILYLILPIVIYWDIPR